MQSEINSLRRTDFNI